MASGEVLEYEEMGKKVLEASANQDITKDRKYLICIQHPCLFLQSVPLVESLYFCGDAFGTGDDGFHFTDWGFAFI